MDNMFGFLNAAPLDERKVEQWFSDDGKRMISTVRVNDGEKPFETAFEHPEYNDGSMVIVEAYDTREEAMDGHGRWLKIMLEGPLPDELTDCCNAGTAQLGNAFGMPISHKRCPDNSSGDKSNG